jgi:predicted RNase H-like HicB family nuclease
MVAVTQYDVTIERDESGAWLAEVPAVPGCHTQGRSIMQALNRTREALGLWVDDAAGAQLVAHVNPPAELRTIVRRLAQAREREQQVHVETRSVLFEALEEAIDSGLSVRDTAELVGLSPQRVHQLADELEIYFKGTPPAQRAKRAQAAKRRAATRKAAARKRVSA